MHHGYAGELEELRRTFYDRFGKDIGIKSEIIEGKAKDIDPNNIEWDNASIEAILEGDKEYSEWQDRDAMWLNKKSQK